MTLGSMFPVVIDVSRSLGGELPGAFVRVFPGIFAAACCKYAGDVMKEFGPIPHRSTHWPLVVMLPAFCPQIAPIVPVLPVVPTRKCCTVYNLRFELFHGMEEVIGPIQNRGSFNVLNAIRSERT